MEHDFHLLMEHHFHLLTENHFHLQDEELAMIREAMAYYRMRGFPMPKGVSQTTQKQWQELGMRVWEKLSPREYKEIKQEEANHAK